MSETEQERIIGRATVEYSEAKKAIAMFRSEFAALGKLLQSIGDSLQGEMQGSVERALHLMSRNEMKWIDAEKLRAALAEFKETQAKFEASRKSLISMGI